MDGAMRFAAMILSRAAFALALAAFAAPLAAGPVAGARSPPPLIKPHIWHGGHPWRPHGRHRYPVVPPPETTILPPPGLDLSPPPPEPFPPAPETPATPAPALRAAPSASFSQGMAITVRKILSEKDDGDREASRLIERPKQAAERLAACWAPPLPQPGETVEVTIRFAFAGNGKVMGSPRFTYVKPAAGMTADQLRESIRAAIKTCGPLRFSKSMAASAPGYPLSVRFIGERAKD